MIDDQQLPAGLNGDHVVYSSFFDDNHIVQQTAIVHPKSLLIDGLRNVFRNDSIFTYRDDEFGYLCRVNDPSELAEKIDFARKNGINPERLITRSKDFTLEKIGPLYEAILNTSN